METKFTPGPWHVSGDKITIVKPHPQATTEFAKQQGYIVARSVYATVDDSPTDETIGNARLIAAAPDLLRACNAALAYLAAPASKFKENRDAAEELIRAAIAKATT